MAAEDLASLIAKAADLIWQAEKIVAFTGAGVSTESGIPDFRSPGGIWERYQPVYYQDFLASEEARKRAWERSKVIYPVIRAAQPNPTHLALAELEKMGKLDCIITQNIDRLHHKAGNSPERIIELHGTNAYVVCLSCHRTYPRDEIQAWLERGTQVPSCTECQGPLKEATISFGQPLPVREIEEAEHRALACDLLLVLGSSLVVYPAAYIPSYARQGGAKLIIINLASTSYDREAEVVIRAKTGEVMPQIVALVKEKNRCRTL